MPTSTNNQPGRGATAPLLLALVVLACLTLPYGFPGMQIRDYRTLALSFSLLPLLFAYVAPSWPLGLFGCWAAATFVLHNGMASASGIIVMLCGFIIIRLSSDLLADRLNLLFNCLCGFVLFQCAWQGLQIVGLDPLFTVRVAGRYAGRELWAGWAGNVDILANLCAFSLPAFFRGRWRLAAIVPVASIIACDVMTAYVIAAAGVVAYFLAACKWSTGLKLYIACMGVGVALVYANGQWPDIAANDRWEIWRKGLLLVREHPLVGWGLGTWKSVFPAAFGPVGGRNILQAHNEYLQVLMELGVPGLATVAAYVGYAMRRTRAHRDVSARPALLAMLVVAAVGACGHFWFHTPEAAWTLLLLGAIEGGGK